MVMDNINWFEVAMWGVPAIVALVGALKGWSWVRGKLNELFDFLAMKTKLGFLANVDEVLVGFATDLYHSEIKLLKAEGQWNKDTGAKMLEVLKAEAKEHFNLDTIGRVMGTDNPAGLIDSRAEAAVIEAKRRGAAANPK
jgi:hypothetical protein